LKLKALFDPRSLRGHRRAALVQTALFFAAFIAAGVGISTRNAFLVYLALLWAVPMILGWLGVLILACISNPNRAQKLRDPEMREPPARGRVNPDRGETPNRGLTPALRSPKTSGRIVVQDERPPVKRSPFSGQPSRVAGAAAGLVLVVVVALAAPTAAPTMSARAFGIPGPSFAGTSTPTGTKRAESVVWWHDNAWWADMWDVRSRDFHIFRYADRKGKWLDTGTAIDRRANTHADVLSEGRTLYVASHKTVRDTAPAVPGTPSYLYRFSYDARQGRYKLDTGFPSVINGFRTETLVIDRDSTGKLWATWRQDGTIYINRSTDNVGRRWGTPFRLPFDEAAVTVDDISSIVAFSGQVGIMWSNQAAGRDAMWFSTHKDGDPDTAWRPPEAALRGDRAADDHINLKADSRGVVYAAVKTSNIYSNPLTLLLVRSPAGVWTSSTYGLASNCDNRPIVVIDESRRIVRMFATGPAPPRNTCSTSGGAIYEKVASIDRVSFTPGRGKLVLSDSLNPFIHNVTSAKRNVPSKAGVLVLAVNQRTRRYWNEHR
jgi:hypothetical protein